MLCVYRLSRFWLFVSTLLMLRCQQAPPTPGLGVQVSVVGNTAPGERATRIDVSFDRAMVPSLVLGRTLPLDSEVPFGIEPAVEGALVWREDRTLSFEPRQPLPRATRFVVTIPEGTRAPDNVGLTLPFRYEFDTERLRVMSELDWDYALPDPSRWATARQAIRLRFSQPVLSSLVEDHCGYRAQDGSHRVPAAMRGSQGRAAEAVDGLTVEPAGPLALDTSWVFECDSGLTSVEGPLGLAGATGEPSSYGAAPRGRLEFRTHGAFRIEGATPSGTAVDPDTTRISVRFHTPPQLDSDSSNPIVVAPKPRAWGDHAWVNGSELVTRVGGLEPNTRYTIGLARPLKDAFGQAQEGELRAEFTTGNAMPAFALETGSWAVENSRGGYVGWVRNVERVEVLAAALTEAQLFDVLPRLYWWDRDAVDLAGFGVASRRQVLRPQGKHNQWSQLVLSPSELLGEASNTGRFYYLAARSPDVLDPHQTSSDGKPLPQGYQEVLLNVTNLGVTTKLSGSSGLVWVTRLSDGEPQAGAEVSIRQRSGALLWQGTTGAYGVVSVPGRAALLAKEGLLAQQDVPEEEGEPQLLVFVRHAGDITFVDPEAAGRFSAWHFNVSDDRSASENALRGFLHTDRGLYRPGDTVHVRGIARLLRLGGGLFVPEDTEVNIQLMDPRGREIAQHRMGVSRFGGFHFDHELSEVAPLGDYRILANLPQGQFSSAFTVEKFRPATFEVQLEAEKKEVFAGERLALSSLGRYFYGAPVRGASVSVRVHSRPREVRFDDYPDFSFSHHENTYDSTNAYGRETLITELDAKLDDAGVAKHEVVLSAEQFTAPATLMVSSTVQDETNQTVTKNLTLPLHQTRHYLGVNTGGWMVEAHQPSKVRVVAVDAAGRGVSAQAVLHVERQDWSCAWERWGYRGSYRCSAERHTVAQEQLALRGVPTEREVVYPGPGEYRVLVEGVDENQRPVRASSTVWVYGEGASAWRVDDSGRFNIIADKKQYAVGEVARLILQTPVQGARGLLTVERDGVLQRRELPKLALGQAIELPITPELAPNAYVSVLLHRGRTGEGERGLPSSRMGLLDISVRPEGKRLSVRLSTDLAEYRPGQTVATRIQVTDSQGRPVQAELALAAADEGVLSLIDFKTPDPLSRFFAPWGLGVQTASQYERLMQLPAPGQERYVTGGDSAGAPGSLRSRFRSTAYWDPSVVTDEDGKAEVAFAAPDNLTAFRLMAVAADSGERFGSGEQRFSVNKPLQLLSALPRFATLGDELEAAVLLTNDTGRAGMARVELALEGGVVPATGPAGASLSKRVSVPAEGRVRVAFPVRARATGPAEFRFSAELAGHRDGLSSSIPVEHSSRPESELLSEGATQGEVRIAVRLPEGVLPDTAQLTLSVDPDGLAGIEQGLEELVQYPYGCLEQVTSRLIPLIAAAELTKTLQLPELQGDKLDRYVRAAIAKIQKHQDLGGGFALWPGSAPDTYLTAFALWGLELSRDAGYEVDDTTTSRGIAYLREQVGSELRPGVRQTLEGELSSRAFALYILSLLEHPEPSAATALALQADRLPLFGKAFLARALAAAVGVSHDSVTSLLSQFQTSARSSGTGALVKEEGGEGLRWYFSSHVRTSAIVTDALLALRPEDPRLPALIRGLLAERRAGGGWYTTQDSLYALVALTNYAKQRAGKDATVEVRHGESVLLREELSGKGLQRLRQLELPIAPGDRRALTVSAKQGTVHYRARVRYRRESQRQLPIDKGLVVERAFFDPETGAELQRAVEGQMVRVKLTLKSSTEHEHVALSDALPAGLEPINSRFATVPANLPPDDATWRNKLWLTHRELGDSRVDAFVEWLPARQGSFEYLARATTVGHFVVPPAVAEKMYDPDLRGRTGLRHFDVVPRKEAKQ